MMALDADVAYDRLDDRQMGVIAQFADPAQPTISATADAWTKIGAADQSLIGTRVWYEGLGLSKATIDRIMAAKDQQGTLAIMDEVFQQLGGRLDG
ncbi:MAG: hypothetical protein IJ781_02785, partial [Atopobiaceae bacterium]|nr:hypothetical protein [Atopobiaceae bacterium]